VEKLKSQRALQIFVAVQLDRMVIENGVYLRNAAASCTSLNLFRCPASNTSQQSRA
jgi:hypothetical protein